MTWKSTAVVSGAGLLATWLASYPPANSVAPSPAADASRTSSASDIQDQASRLETKVRQAVEFEGASRNLFRFRAAERRPADQRLVTPAFVEPALPVALPPAIKLSGLAIDVVDGQEVRTAILSTPGGLLFAKEGDSLPGSYKVETITEGFVEISSADGSRLQLR